MAVTSTKFLCWQKIGGLYLNLPCSWRSWNSTRMSWCTSWRCARWAFPLLTEEYSPISSTQPSESWKSCTEYVCGVSEQFLGCLALSASLCLVAAKLLISVKDQHCICRNICSCSIWTCESLGFWVPVWQDDGIHFFGSTEFPSHLLLYGLKWEGGIGVAALGYFADWVSGGLEGDVGGICEKQAWIIWV